MHLFKAIGNVLLTCIIAVIGLMMVPYYLLGLGKRAPKETQSTEPEAAQSFPKIEDPVSTQSTIVEREFDPIPSSSSALDQIADVHIRVWFSDSFAATVSIHKKQNLVKRKMRAISAPASTLLKNIWLRDSWDMGDIRLTPETTIERALLQTEEEGEKMIREILAVKEPQYLSALDMFRSRYKAENPMPTSPAEYDAEATNLALAALRTDSARPKAVTGLQFTDVQEKPKAEAKSTDRRQSEEIIEGRVMSAEQRSMTFSGGTTPAPVFEVTIQDAHGELHSKRGIRLQELFVQHQVVVGDHIRLECLGKTKVDSQNSAPGKRPTTRNEFRIEKLTSVGA
jgi:hypothetical protein